MLHLGISLLAAFLLDPDDAEFQKKVDAAIDKGCAYLLKQHKNGTNSDPKKTELILLTLVHAGIRRDHPFIVANMNKLLGRPLQDTYNVGLRALLLEKLNRKYYQEALAEIAMFFADSQCQNGQWTYTGKSRKGRSPGYAPTPTKRTDDRADTTRSDDDGIPPGKPKKLPPPLSRSGVKSGDNSNTQYAVLGLFAAERANVQVPKEVWEDVEKWFESQQNGDGGWGYGPGTTSTGSMTTCGLTALIVAKFYLGKEWKDDERVKKGLAWLGSHLIYDSNPGSPNAWHYYYLYGLERVGMISGLKEFGGKDWYRGGAEWLIANQKDDGRWDGSASGRSYDEEVDTCFAILFLRRATPELKKPKDVATGDGHKPAK